MKTDRAKVVIWLLFVLATILSLPVHQSSASDFSPTMLALAAPDMVGYDFDGSSLEIPVEVFGTEATVIFSIFTKDSAQNIKNIRNGHIGWHYVNSIDTCMYVSSPYKFSPGRKIVEWDGNASDGTRVNNGEYRYYLWAYDHTDMGQTVTRNKDIAPTDFLCLTHDIEGNPFNYPVLFSGGNTYHTGNEPAYVTRSKWIVGNDPNDESLVETTGYSAWIDRGALAVDQYENDCFFTAMFMPNSG